MISKSPTVSTVGLLYKLEKYTTVKTVANVLIIIKALDQPCFWD